MYKDRYYKGKIRKDTFLWLVAAGLIAAITVGGVGEASLENNEETSTPKADVSSSTINISADGTIQSISFKRDAEIRDVLRFLGAKYNKNIVPSPKIEGTITVTNLYNVTFEQAMDAILGDNIQWEQRGNIIDVFTKEDKNRMRYKVFTLSYISADEAKKLIAPVLSDQGQIGTSTAAETGVPTGESISQSSGGVTMAVQDTIVIYDYPERIAQAAEVIKAVDIKPKQVLIEATILSVLLTEGMKFGVDLNFEGGLPLTGFKDTLTTTVAGVDVHGNPSDTIISEDLSFNTLEQIHAGLGDGNPIETSGFADVGGSGLRIGVRSGNVAAFITALETVTDTTVLANPKILAVNKQLGQVYIGTKIGYVSQTNQTQTSTTQQVEFLDTGTKLSFRPYIGDDGYIRMDILPKDSSGTLKANDIPDETSTELATNVVVRDGETIVIGGLFRDVTVTTRSQVPLLGDLPLVGAAFRSTLDTVQRQEVIVLLTPHIIEESADTMASARIDDIRQKRAGAKEELHILSRAKQAEDRYAQAAKYYLEGFNEAAIEQLDQALRHRPTYLEALRLKERIIKETRPEDARSIESMIIESVERKDSEVWLRR